MPPKLGIVAGGGQLPARIIEACRRTGRDFFVVAIEGQTDPATVADGPHAWVRLGAAGRALDHLKQAGVQELVLAGTIRRPSLAALRPDAWAAAFFARSGAAILGDDGLLTALVKTLERDEGLRVVGAEALVPDLIAREGPYGRHAPNDAARRDIALGIAAAQAIGAKDIGQSAVVLGGRVIGVEDAAGTDALLGRVAGAAAGGVLVKVAKPGQERRVDLPTIGAGTVKAALAAGLKGIAIEAGGALVIDRDALAAAADAAGLFIVGVAVTPARTPAGAGGGPLVFVIAGEPSGDALGARVMAALKAKTGGRARFAGIGGPRMAQEGLVSLFPMAELTVMGLTEVLPRLPNLIGRLNATVRAVRACRPDALLTIDSPDFTLRVARRLKGRGIPLIHYVAPTVWAWRPKRARRIARFLDHLMALLPFEPPYFEAHGLACTFVGHPVLESGADRGDGPAFRARHGIAPKAPLLCVLPGSRTSEVRRLLPVFGAAVGRLAQTHPALRVVVPTVAAVADAVAADVAAWPGQPLVVEGEGEKFDAFAAADAALAASGTVALELALARTPTIITYKVSPLTAWLARRLVTVRFVSLVNLVLDRAATPELLQEDCRSDRLADAVTALLDIGAARQVQRAALDEAMARLGRGERSPSARAAEVVLAVIAGYAKRTEKQGIDR